jgi:hypothetical protein
MRFWIRSSFYLYQSISEEVDECQWYSYCPVFVLTPRSRVLLEKLTGLQLVKKFPAFCGTRRFITAFTSAHHLSLYWASSIQSIPPTSYSLKITVLSGSSKLIDVKIGFWHLKTFLKGGCTNSRRLSFVWWLLIFLGPGRGDFFV